ncbi:MAG: hypothetical protein WC988_03975 [Patescibacteria group bacterium]
MIKNLPGEHSTNVETPQNVEEAVSKLIVEGNRIEKPLPIF